MDTASGPGTALVRSRPIWEREGAAIILEVAYDLGVALFSISTTHTVYAVVMAENLGPCSVRGDWFYAEPNLVAN